MVVGGGGVGRWLFVNSRWGVVVGEGGDEVDDWKEKEN
jgi:hypothetical protein